MSRLSELLKSQVPIATSATPATQVGVYSESSNCSESSSRVGVELHLSPDLEQRIQRMATRWRYTNADLAEVIELARVDPYGWTLAVLLDERREAEFREYGLLQ